MLDHNTGHPNRIWVIKLLQDLVNAAPANTYPPYMFLSSSAFSPGLDELAKYNMLFKLDLRRSRTGMENDISPGSLRVPGRANPLVVAIRKPKTLDHFTSGSRLQAQKVRFESTLTTYE